MSNVPPINKGIPILEKATNFLSGQFLRWLQVVQEEVNLNTKNLEENFYSDTYTPTASNLSNIDSVTIAPLNYIRSGNLVNVFGEITIDNTAIGLSQFTINIPISSNLSSNSDASGSIIEVFSSGRPLDTGCIFSLGFGQLIIIRIYVNTTTSQQYTINFSYLIK